ncbi:MAG: ParB/RepB/Spo0J family partition protein [Fibrobacter sp.]|nr:ParB/RepB/Spo0J family partition protein [Fibrobacter sp.]
MGKKALGRSLHAVFGDSTLAHLSKDSADNSVIEEINLKLIEANPFQPRTVFNESELAELAETIKEHGLIQPITVRKHKGKFQIISGERRMRATALAGIKKIEARVIDKLSDKTMMEWAIIENIQRVDLNPIEVAKSYEQLIENHGYTHNDLAERLGKSRSAITNSLRLLKLPEKVLLWIKEGKLSAGHARALLGANIKDPEKKARKIIEDGLNVREVEKAAQAKKSKRSKPIAPNMQELINELQYALGTRVKIVEQNSGKGQIILEFMDGKDLNRLSDALRSIQV